MSGGNPGNNPEHFRLFSINSPGWNPGYLGEHPFPDAIQLNGSGHVPSNEDITPIMTLDEERNFRNLLSFGWSILGDHYHQELQALREDTNDVTTNAQDVQSNANHLDWPTSDDFQAGKSRGLAHGHLEDASYIERMNYPANEFFHPNPVPSPYNLTAHGCSPHLSHHQKIRGEQLVAVGNFYGDNYEDLAGYQFDGPEGLPTAAIDKGMYSLSTPLPSNDPLGEFRRDLQKLSDQVEQASLALATSLALGPSHCYPPSCPAFSPSNLPLDPVAAGAVTAFPEGHNSSDLLPNSVLPKVEHENITTHFGTTNEFLPPSNTPSGELGFFEPTFSLDASCHDYQARAFSAPGNSGPPPPEYSGYTMGYPALQYESLLKPLKSLSPSSSSFAMDPPTLNTPKTPAYSPSFSSPSTADARSSKKRSSFTGRITFPSPIKEFNYDYSSLITKKSRGRRPLTRPSLGKWSDDDAQFSNIDSKLAPGGQALGPLCTVTSDPALLNLMETAKTSNVKKAFVCQVGDCGKCFRRCEHLRRHVRTIHSAEKPYQCPWANCKRTFNRNDNLKQHFQIHLRKSEMNN